MAHGDSLTNLLERSDLPLGGDASSDENADLHLLCGFADVAAGLRSRNLHEMLDYYAGLVAQQGGLPPVGAFDPVALPCHIPNLLSVHVERQAGGDTLYRYILFGTGLRVLFGTNMAGRLVDEHSDPHHVGRVMRVYPHVAKTGAPVRSQGHLITRNGIPVRGEAVLMPFGEMGVVTHVIGAVDYDTDL